MRIDGKVHKTEGVRRHPGGRREPKQQPGAGFPEHHAVCVQLELPKNSIVSIDGEGIFDEAVKLWMNGGFTQPMRTERNRLGHCRQSTQC